MFSPVGQHPPATSRDQIVRVDVDGKRAAWTPTEGFTGDPDLVRAAHLAVDIRMSVDVGEHLIEADATSALGALGALCSYRPGRSRVLSCPESISEQLFDTTN